MWNSVAATLFIILPLAGLVLLILGFRGPRVDTLPRCARCRFETTGLSAGVPCPECGSDLSRRGAISIGRRRKRYAALALGMLLLLITAGAGVTAFALGINNPANNPRKPNWLLQLEAQRSNTRLAAAAISELTARIGTLSMSNDTANALLDRALTVQADPRAPWIPEWADLILACRRVGLCDDPTYLKFVRQGVAFTWTPRPIVRAGQQIPASFERSAPRLGSQSVHLRIEHAELSYNSIPQDHSEGRNSVAISSNGSSASVWQIPAVDTPGEVAITQSYRIQLTDGSQTREINPALSWTQTFTSTVRVVDANATIIETETTHSPEVMKAGLKISPLKLEQWSEEPHLSFRIDSDGKLPVALACTIDAFWTTPDGQETKVTIGTLALRAGSASAHSTGRTITLPPNFIPTQARIVLRPSTDAAEDTIDLTRIWSGPDLVFDNVPITDRRTPDESAP